MLNESKGNMYGFVSHTWNPIKGKCLYNCCYCYMKRFPQKDLRFDTNEMKTDLGYCNTIFVGSSVDMFAGDVPDKWIVDVLAKCRREPTNRYLFQSKNVSRMLSYYNSGGKNSMFPEDCIFGTTIETDVLPDGVSDAPAIRSRMDLKYLPYRMVTIEPIMDFNLRNLVDIIRYINPMWVNIGADSSRRKALKEPTKDKVISLIKELEKFTTVKGKHNLSRILVS